MLPPLQNAWVWASKDCRGLCRHCSALQLKVFCVIRNSVSNAILLSQTPATQSTNLKPCSERSSTDGGRACVPVAFDMPSKGARCTRCKAWWRMDELAASGCRRCLEKILMPHALSRWGLPGDVPRMVFEYLWLSQEYSLAKDRTKKRTGHLVGDHTCRCAKCSGIPRSVNCRRQLVQRWRVLTIRFRRNSIAKRVQEEQTGPQGEQTGLRPSRLQSMGGREHPCTGRRCLRRAEFLGLLVPNWSTWSRSCKPDWYQKLWPKRKIKWVDAEEMDKLQWTYLNILFILAGCKSSACIHLLEETTSSSTLQKVGDLIDDLMFEGIYDLMTRPADPTV